MKISLLRIFAVLTLCLFVSPFATAQEVEQDKVKKPGKSTMEKLREKLTGLSKGEITILASGSTEIGDDGWMTVIENAEINLGGGKILMADLIRFHAEDGILRAEGNVILLENDIRISGKSIDLNIDTNVGSLVEPYMETKDGYIISGASMDKTGPDSYLIHDGTITTCNQPTRQWTMSAKKIDIKADGRATLYHLVFRLNENIPLLYLPWLPLPMDKERSSGFLMPTFGTSEFLGKWIGGEYFWAINDSHDATFGANYYSERGNRFTFEYRNDLGNGNTTSFNWSQIADEGFYLNKDETRDRYYGEFSNRTTLPFGFKLSANMQFMSDNKWWADFVDRNRLGYVFYSRSVTLTNSIAGINFNVGYNERMRFLGPNRLVGQRLLPAFSVSSSEKKIFNSPLFYSFKGAFIMPDLLDVSKGAAFDREDIIKSEKYQRLDLRGNLLMPITNFSPWLTVSPRVEARSTFYSRSYDRKARQFVDESVRRNYLETGIDVTGPVVSRVYGDAVSSSYLLKHVITPKFNYIYRSQFDMEDQKRIIILDGEDNFFRVHQVKWSLGTTLFYKKNKTGATIYDLFSLNVSQYVSIEDDLLTSFDKRYVLDPTAAEVLSRFSPLMINLRSNLINKLRLEARLEYDHQLNTLRNYTISGGVSWRNINYNIGWYRSNGVIIFNQVGAVSTDTNRVVTSGNIGLFDGKVRLRGAYDYNIQQQKLMNYMAGIDIHGQCLGAGFEIRRMNYYGRDDFQTMFKIVIGGLGDILGGGKDQ